MWQLLWPAWLGGCLLAITAAPLGCLLVWRRLAYFGDSLAHATLLGVALSLWWQIPVWGGIVAVCILLAVTLTLALNRQQLPSDALLSLLSAGSLSAGLVALSQLTSVRVDLLAYLFGDLLSLQTSDLPWLVGVLFLVLTVVMVCWRGFVLTAVDEDLAAVEGWPVQRLRLLLLLLLALVVTMAMKVVGSLLITALLVIPALIVRPLVHNPVHMAIGAALAGILAITGGLSVSVWWDTPVGPSIVVIAVLLFLLVQTTKKIVLR